jgi:WD40 repeat protein
MARAAPSIHFPDWHGHAPFARAWVACCPDGKTPATGSEDRSVRLWDAQVGETVRSVAGSREGGRPVAFRQDGSLLKRGGWDDWGDDDRKQFEKDCGYNGSPTRSGRAS